MRPKSHDAAVRGLRRRSACGSALRRAVRRGRRRSDETGTGTAIGVAVIYPMLIVVIVALHAIIDASRAEHSLQAAVDRAARAASLCCERVADAHARARTSMAASPAALACVNDAAAEADVSFFDIAGSPVHPVDPPSSAADEPGTVLPRVPRGGTVQVRVACTLPTSAWGRMFAGPTGVQRHALGQAIVDPYRSRLPSLASGGP